MTKRSKLFIFFGLLGLNSLVFHVSRANAAGYGGICASCLDEHGATYTCCQNCTGDKCDCSNETDC